MGEKWRLRDGGRRKPGLGATRVGQGHEVGQAPAPPPSRPYDLASVAFWAPCHSVGPSAPSFDSWFGGVATTNASWSDCSLSRTAEEPLVSWPDWLLGVGGNTHPHG